MVGEAIPLAGRIVAVADVFDALTQKRPYKAAWPVGEAVAEIERQRGRQFDPALVDAFLRVIAQPASSLRVGLNMDDTRAAQIVELAARARRGGGRARAGRRPERRPRLGGRRTTLPDRHAGAGAGRDPAVPQRPARRSGCAGRSPSTSACRRYASISQPAFDALIERDARGLAPLPIDPLRAVVARRPDSRARLR